MADDINLFVMAGLVPAIHHAARVTVREPHHRHHLLVMAAQAATQASYCEFSL